MSFHCETLSILCILENSCSDTQEKIPCVKSLGQAVYCKLLLKSAPPGGVASL